VIGVDTDFAFFLSGMPVHGGGQRKRVALVIVDVDEETGKARFAATINGEWRMTPPALSTSRRLHSEIGAVLLGGSCSCTGSRG
jgi:hypothetical protein